jgi:hypothetical protein
MPVIVDRLQLVDHREDRLELRVHLRRLRVDLDAGEVHNAPDVVERDFIGTGADGAGQLAGGGRKCPRSANAGKPHIFSAAQMPRVS